MKLRLRASRLEFVKNAVVKTLTEYFSLKITLVVKIFISLTWLGQVVVFSVVLQRRIAVS